MLIVRIELHSAVTGEIKTVATGKIVNTGERARSRTSRENGCSLGTCCIAP
jgi:hypothetical protein